MGRIGMYAELISITSVTGYTYFTKKSSSTLVRFRGELTGQGVRGKFGINFC
jgi:hypothetical protein